MKMGERANTESSLNVGRAPKARMWRKHGWVRESERLTLQEEMRIREGYKTLGGRGEDEQWVEESWVARDLTGDLKA